MTGPTTQPDVTYYRPAFGIPYAPQIGVTKAVAKLFGSPVAAVCPRCGKDIPLIERKDFESYSGVEYADHYNAEHAVADGRVLYDGVWYEPIEGEPK